jgi:hypothetical protein
VNEPGTAEAMISHLPPKAAMMAAVEILLAEPAALGDDTLESGLYMLRELILMGEQGIGLLPEDLAQHRPVADARDMPTQLPAGQHARRHPGMTARSPQVDLLDRPLQCPVPRLPGPPKRRILLQWTQRASRHGPPPPSAGR